MLHSTIDWVIFAIMNIENSKAQMRKGILEYCILAIIAAEQEAYPSDIIRIMKEGEIIVVEGTLYPILTRLKNGGLLNYTWRESASGPPRKYYSLTELGKGFLKELDNTWVNLSASVSKIIKTTDHEKNN